VVLDGGSTDGTQEILDFYSDQIQWHEAKGEGQSKAINTGWKMTSGEIIAWINSDDIYSPGTFTQVCEYFNQNPDTDLIYGDCDFIDSHGETLRSYPTREYDYLGLIRNTENYLPQPAVFIRRRVLDNIGYLNESLDYVMDFEFWLRIGLKHHIEYVPNKLASLRLHEDAKSIAGLKYTARELVQVYKEFFNHPDLSPEILSLQKDAMANIYYRAADCAYWGNDYKSARLFAKNSRHYKPWNLHSLWFWVALGRYGSTVYRKIHKNPYFV
jgi:glycosyltransferase involved in cell wall biosynthesis